MAKKCPYDTSSAALLRPADKAIFFDGWDDNDFHNPARLITFGSPLVGDARFRKLLEHMEVRRYVDCCDVVARVPPERFDQAHLTRLFAELADPARFGWLGRWLARSALTGASVALAGIFAATGLDGEFDHVSRRLYIRQNGAPAPDFTEEDSLQDQDAARVAYRQNSEAMSARCLTGWTVRPRQGGFLHFQAGKVEFDASLHDDGPKEVLGRRIPAGLGKGDLDRVIEIVSLHPSTAE